MAPIPDKCGGSGKIVHLTDSYSKDVWDCPGCEDCNKKETPMTERTIALRVSIPVSIGGYTGQRDQWEEYERHMNVGLDGDTVSLSDTGGGLGRQIKMSRAGLEAALQVLSEYKS